MYCRKCGRKLADDANFCHFCGTKIVFCDQENNVDSKKESNPEPDTLSAAGDTNPLQNKSEKDLHKKKFPIWGYVVIAIFVSIFLIGAALLVINTARKSILSEGNKTDFSLVGNGNGSKKKDLSENPENYNPDIFELSGSSSPYLGQSISVLNQYYDGKMLVFDGAKQLRSNFGIQMKEGQQCYLVHLSFGSETEFFIADENDIVVGYALLDDMKNVSDFLQGEKISPKMAKASAAEGPTGNYNLLCWKLDYGYRFQLGLEANDSSYQNYFSYGYFELVDPTQCKDFKKILAAEFEQRYGTANGMPAGLQNMIEGHYQEGNVRFDVASSVGIFRSVLNCKEGEKDYFFCDKYDSYEKIADNTYLVKVKCGDTPLSYLVKKEEEGNILRITLCFNVVDGWEYSDDYTNDSKYCFTNEFEVIYAGTSKDHDETASNPELNSNVDILSELNGLIDDSSSITLEELSQLGYSYSLFYDHSTPGVALPYKLYKIDTEDIYAVVYSYDFLDYSDNTDNRISLFIDNVEDPEDQRIYDRADYLFQLYQSPN